jgi:hypothetical protein
LVGTTNIEHKKKTLAGWDNINIITGDSNWKSEGERQFVGCLNQQMEVSKDN